MPTNFPAGFFETKIPRVDLSLPQTGAEMPGELCCRFAEAFATRYALKALLGHSALRLKKHAPKTDVLKRYTTGKPY